MPAARPSAPPRTPPIEESPQPVPYLFRVVEDVLGASAVRDRIRALVSRIGHIARGLEAHVHRYAETLAAVVERRVQAARAEDDHVAQPVVGAEPARAELLSHALGAAAVASTVDERTVLEARGVE